MATSHEEPQLQNGVIPEADQIPIPETNHAPEPEPEPETNPSPEPEPTPVPQSEANPVPEPTPVLQSEPNPVPEPESNPATEIEVASEQEPPAKTEQDANHTDLKLELVKETSIQSTVAAVKVPSTEPTARPHLHKDQGNKTFTMRELLSDLKSDEGDESLNDSAVSPYSQESTTPHVDNHPAMELINSITVSDEEGRSRQRVLAFAARKYASSVERNPEDYDALYNWALVLQESADNVSPDSTSPSKDDLLEEACKKYDEATGLCPTLHDAFYNWAIAISDRAKMRGRTKEAEELWKQATNNYEKAVELNWNSPQALNNWGLALQELSLIVPVREKQTIVRSAISKFRAAIRLQFDFHRAIYNLGTVLYGLAEDTLRSGGSGKVPPNELYSQSAIYIAAAHALKPSYSVYSSALRLVRSMLPLPHFKVGYFTAPPVGSSLAPHSDWKRSEFSLNHERLQQVNKSEQNEITQNLPDKKIIRINIPDIVSVSACSDLTLPPGAGLCIDTIHGPVFLVVDSWEALDGWLDALRLVYTIYARGFIYL